MRREELIPIVHELSARPGHEKVRSLLYRLLVEGLSVESRAVDFEKQAPEVHGRMDALLGRTIFEIKSDLRQERREAEAGLARYLTERQGQTGQEFVGIAVDGADFLVYFLAGGRVVEVASHRTDPKQPAALLPWLQGVVALAEELDPDTALVESQFGRESLAAQRALASLEELWNWVGQSPEARLKQELWQRLLGLAYGAEIGSDQLFFQHTYLAIVAKAVAWSAVIGSAPRSARALLHGDAFLQRGFSGQSEPDFFDWMLARDSGCDLVMRVWQHANRFRWTEIRTDVLRSVYESLIDPETRHDLGEYYTPDWLAARTVAEVFHCPLEQRIMDPSCGSGTFLFHAVRQVLSAAASAGIPAGDAVRRATSNVVGVDVHPLAVIFARVTYLLALIPALRDSHPGEVPMPVFMGDSLQWNVANGGGSDDGLLFADEDSLDILVPEVVVSEPVPKHYGAAILRFPGRVVSNARMFDLTLQNIISFSVRSAPEADFRAWLQRTVPGPDSDREILQETYKLMRDLHAEGRDHVWSYVARNLARPAWLSSETQRADVLVGNPPWVAYRHMTGGFKRRFRDESRKAGLWVGGKVATQSDLSAYFFLRSAHLYLRPKGRMAMVMPYAALSRQAFSRFRQGALRHRGACPFQVRFTGAWAFGPDVAPVFPVPCCVLFCEPGESVDGDPLPSTVKRYAGTLPKRDASPLEADECLAESTAPWPTEASDRGGSPYRTRFRNGATLFPRRLVLVESAPVAGMLPPNPVTPLLRGRVSNLDKPPWKTLDPPEGRVERQFVRPVIMGESVVPFRLLSASRGIIPWDDEQHDLMDSVTASRRGFGMLADWLIQTEVLWEKHRRSKFRFLDQLDFYGKLTAQFPIAPLRVTYTASGGYPTACLVREAGAIIEHNLYWAEVESVNEGRYLCAVMNSETLRTQLEPYQAQGQWGSRHIDKYIFNLPIPLFNGADRLHRDIADIAGEAEDLVYRMDVRKNEYFVTMRQRVRSELAAKGVTRRIERLISRLLGQ